MENMNDMPETEQEYPEIPSFVMALLDSAKWVLPKPISKTSHQTYYYAYDFHNRTSVIYNKDKVIVEDPTLFSISTDEENLVYFGVAGKSVAVNITDTNSLAELSELVSKPHSFNRFEKDFWLDSCHFILYHFSMEKPIPTTPHANEIYSWIVEKVSLSISNDVDAKVGKATYKGRKNDMKALSEFAANRYFDHVRTEYADLEELPNFLHRNFDMRARLLTEQFVTYQKATHNHAGGAHGYYTEELISYDFINKQEIDWKYLFKPQHQKEVEELFIDHVCKDCKYAYMEDAENREKVIWKFSTKNENGNPTDELLIPQPALTEEGIVFSVQPYEISFFAAGTFHFIIPYDKAEPYMTDKGKRCLSLIRQS